jgi:hypothetical protein
LEWGLLGSPLACVLHPHPPSKRTMDTSDNMQSPRFLSAFMDHHLQASRMPDRGNSFRVKA